MVISVHGCEQDKTTSICIQPKLSFLITYLYYISSQRNVFWYFQILLPFPCTFNTLYFFCQTLTYLVSERQETLTCGMIPLQTNGGSRRRCVDNIRMDLQEMGCWYMDWIGLAQDRDRWRTLVSAVMNLQVPWNAGNFLTSCKPVSFSRRTQHHGVSK